LAKRVAGLVEFMRSSETVAGIESKWKHKATRALLDEVQIASPADYERLTNTFNDLRSDLELKAREVD
jgi:hypothetical protein